jgi:ABC-type polysaccharide/polyol phosphate transport system ATPase subunit
VPAIELDHVGKRFVVSGGRPRTIREFLRHAGRASPRPPEDATFWGLRDVSLTVERGETLGLIGPNGSGKSTILKLVSGIMRPTRGRVRVWGSVSALIELGVGFHPEFSGRENVYVYGALLGLNRGEVNRKLAAIVDFAELGRFVDEPVKHYSSGMYMRLAFAVAAHVEPEILLIDEVLAVGDEGFQQKCLARVHELQQAGVTVVFVSHALGIVESLCDRVCWLERGEVRQSGPPAAVIAAYHQATSVAAPALSAREW